VDEFRAKSGTLWSRSALQDELMSLDDPAALHDLRHHNVAIDYPGQCHFCLDDMR
jgi:hypothetical protein